MLEDKKTGLLIAETKDEAIWFQIMENMKVSISRSEMAINQAKKDLKTKDREIIKAFKNGCKDAIKQNEATIRINKEILLIAESKLKFPETKNSK